MLIRNFLQGTTGLVALVALATTATAAPDVTITDAKIAAGKLVITGKTAIPRMKIRLDGKSGADFNVVSKADKSFSLGVAYLPKDCVVQIQKMSLSSTIVSSTDVVVANCVPTQISPRGDWSKTESYEMLDLVTHGGSSWLAKRDNLNAEPSKGADWQLFAQGELENSAADNSGASETETTDAGAKSKSTRAERAAQRRVPPTGPAGGDLAGTYPDPTIQVGAVVTNRIANGAVTTIKIVDGAVTTNKIGNDAVSAGRIQAGAVINSRLAPNAVTSDKILDNTITGADVFDGTLTDVDLAINSVGSSEIQTDAVNATEIADNSIDSGEIADNSLFADDLAANSVGNSELQDNAVASATIVNSTITGADIANNSLTTADIDGTAINGQVNLANVANGRCVQVNFAVPGSVVGEAVVIALNGAVQNGIILYPQRVSANGTVQANICNFTGAAMNPIVDMPVRIITFN